MTTLHQPRRYSVFLSMTTKGSLEEVRRRLAAHTVACGHFPITMDLWPSSSYPVRHVIRSELSHCDVYVAVIGAEYGSICADEGMSYTELEFDEALKLNKPILAYVLNDDEHKRATIQLKKAGRELDAERLKNFREKVNNPNLRSPRHFSLNTIPELEVDFLRALQQQAASLREGGWVRESDVRDAIQLNETIRNNEFFERFVQRLKAFPTLSQRTGVGREEKVELARFFWSRYFAKLAIRKVNRLYFESGSTLAYAGRELLRMLPRPYVRHYIDGTRADLDQEFRIYTNNILIYLEVALAAFDSDPIRIKRLPIGPADPYYGAMFGELTSLVDVPASLFNCELPVDAVEKINRLAQNIEWKMGNSGVILMAASGLNLSQQQNGMSGPHVGSYYNMLIKMALVKSLRPIALFVHSTKIENETFRRNTCFPVCQEGITGTWSDVVERQPMAIVTCARSESAAEGIVQLLRQFGFEHFEANWCGSEGVLSTKDIGDAPDIIVIVASNKQFQEWFDGPAVGVEPIRKTAQ